MTSEKDRDQPGRFGWVVVVALVLSAVLALGLALGSYVAYFGNRPIVPDAAAWGRFGDFVGGILTPLVGLLATLAIVWSMKLMRYELANATRAVQNMAPSPAPVISEASTAVAGGGADDGYRTLELIHQDLKEQLAARLCVIRLADGIEVAELPYVEHLPKGAREVQIAQLLRESVQDPILREALAAQQRNGLLQVAELLQLLARCLIDHEAGARGNSAGMYFRRRYATSAVALQKLGLLPEKVTVFYRDYKNGKGRPGNDPVKPEGEP